MFKSMLMIGSLLLAVTSQAASIECALLTNAKGKVTKKSIPVSKDAQNLADQLNVKTCNRERFEAVAAKNGGIKSRVATKEERTAYLLKGTEDIKL